ncbi:Asp-tRNA(Asn)/Glu-tRNA(Gln) amidotransferase subunit GatC [Ructibacterium gallinarum]|uniref:Aspartyl/glutamyl-tRNA(Asn/Gln) amidotransferase subunit C n=1 Tax=Ructibacterium gallinarum TaxID=2779355 RepID=A0A9D5R7V0_9FIRM|nr:Asp-tRNA(Asn)/Glu-tRNA(Gln) amidotransferase subunit GatC [Ructibacterium gallinarum]MBE5039641.1 Asp-tRNA(Asn)/Glu-tRNA(Gln) amidotransferase subunit GatC [Ructibacterium gallinarum]
MNMNHELVSNLAQLSALELSENEMAAVSKNLTAVLESMEILQSLPLDDENDRETFFSAAELRQDEVRLSFCREDILQNAPQTDGSYFIIPKTIK